MGSGDRPLQLATDRTLIEQVSCPPQCSENWNHGSPLKPSVPKHGQLAYEVTTLP